MCVCGCVCVAVCVCWTGGQLPPSGDVKSALRSLSLHFDACKRLAITVATRPDEVAGYFGGVPSVQATSMVRPARMGTRTQ